MIYLVVFIILLFSAIRFDLIGGTKKAHVWYWVLLLMLVLLSGLRYRIGTDTITYESWYEASTLPPLNHFSLKDLSNNRFEPLFVLLGSFLKMFSKDWLLFQMVHAAIVNFAFFWAIKKYSPAPFIGITIYYLSTFYALNCEVMRQSLATAVLVFSLPYLFSKRFAIYFLIVFIAVFIHRASVLFFLLPFITFLRSTKVLIVTILTLAISAAALSHYIMSHFFDIILLFQSSDALTATLENYGDLESLTAFQFTIFGIIGFFMSTIVMYVICKMKEDGRVVVKKGINGLCEYDLSKMGHLLSFYIIMQTLSFALPIFYRFAWVLFLFPIFYLSSFILHMCKSRLLENKMLLGLVLFLFMFKFVSDNFHEEKDMGLYYYQRYTPYSSVFEQKIDNDRETLFMMYNKIY